MPREAKRPVVSDPIPVFAAYGKKPEDSEASLFEIFMDPGQAANYVFDGVMAALTEMRMIDSIKSGDQISFLFTAGDGEGSMTSSSLVVTHKDERAVFDYHVEKRWARR